VINPDLLEACSCFVQRGRFARLPCLPHQRDVLHADRSRSGRYSRARPRFLPPARAFWNSPASSVSVSRERRERHSRARPAPDPSFLRPGRWCSGRQAPSMIQPSPSAARCLSSRGSLGSLVHGARSRVDPSRPAHRQRSARHTSITHGPATATRPHRGRRSATATAGLVPRRVCGDGEVCGSSTSTSASPTRSSTTGRRRKTERRHGRPDFLIATGASTDHHLRHGRNHAQTARNNQLR
jgi:hypothetical protein